MRDFEGSYDCETGNCTWPRFETLGVCSHCNVVDVTEPSTCQSHSVGTEHVGCTYTTPDNTSFTLVYSTTLQSGSIYLSTLYASSRYSDISMIGTDGAIMEVTAMQPGAVMFPANGTAPPPIAHQCTLSLCAKEVVSSIRPGGVLEEHVDAIHPLRFQNCSSSAYEFDGQGCVGVKDRLLPPGPELDLQRIPPDATQYKVDLVSLATIVGGFQEIIPKSRSDNASVPSKGIAAPPLVRDALNSVFDVDFNLMLDSLARSLTNWIRESPTAASIHGTTWEPAVFVDVAWPWLVYPAALIASTAIFLLISIMSSLEGSNLVWKSSALALHFHKLQGWEPEEVDFRNEKHVEEMVEGLWVRWTGDKQSSVSFVRA